MNFFVFHQKSNEFAAVFLELKFFAPGLLESYFPALESLEDLQRVQVQLGLEPSTPVHKNKSKHGTYHDDFTDETRQRIAEVYAEDIELFGYTY